MYSVLLVEDDRDLLFLLSGYALWKSSGFAVADTAGHGGAALDLLAQKRYDLIITDIRMPLMDGLELIRALRASGDDTCIIVASTFHEFEYAKEAMRLGALDFIEKPFTEQKLAEALVIARRHLDARADAGGADLDAAIPPARRRECYRLLLRGEEAAMDALRETRDRAGDGAAALMDALTGWLREELRGDFPWLDLVERLPGGSPSWIEQAESMLRLARIFGLSRLDPLCRRVCAVAGEHLASGRIIELAAKELQLSRDHLSRQFHGATGMLLSDYITLLRLERAKLLLAESDLRVYEVSEQVGYATTDYFTRLFKRHTGQTPLQYRKGVEGRRSDL